LTAEDGSKSVMVIDSAGTAQQKKVALGISDGDDVEVLSGLGATDQVIVGGAYGLDPGTKVKIGKVGEDDSGGGEDK